MKDALWPVARLEEALCRLGGKPASASTFGSVARAIATPRDIQALLYAAAAREDLEVEPVTVHGRALEGALRASAPLLVVVFQGALALTAVRGARATLLLPDGGRRVVPLRSVADAVRELWERKVDLGPIDPVLARARVSAERRGMVRSALVELRLASLDLEVGWSVRHTAGHSILAQLVRLGQLSTSIKLGVAFALLQVVSLGAWSSIGRGALSGSFDRGWLGGCALALVSGAALQVMMIYWSETLSIALGAIIKRRLLLGTLRLDPQVMRSEGIGRAMGRVLEAEVLESLSLAGGFQAGLAALQLVVALRISVAAGGWLVGSFVALIAVIGVTCFGLYRRAVDWTDRRLELTHALVEELVGHRTRMAQGDPERLHEASDQLLERYAVASQSSDRLAAAAEVLVPGGTIVVGLLGLAPLFLSDTGRTELWVGVGAVFLAQLSLVNLFAGLSAVLKAVVALRRAKPLLEAARGREETATELGLMTSLQSTPDGAVLLEARQIDVRFGADRPAVLRNVNLALRAGESIVLEGPSGSGKSALASLLGGLRMPSSGLLLLCGLDRHSLGAATWRKKVSAAPQYHENHILQGSLAFNLLLGREWPATPAELAEAERVCHELGLGELLDRMPNRLMQTVGTTGWRLSHGEQSRIYLARALLQNAELTILDESLAALDPENLALAMDCIRRRSKTLLLIAHP